MKETLEQKSKPNQGLDLSAIWTWIMSFASLRTTSPKSRVPFYIAEPVSHVDGLKGLEELRTPEQLRADMANKR